MTVAQALHWFDLSSFYPEVRRVARPGGILAVWCYEMHHITPEIDAIVAPTVRGHRRTILAARAPDRGGGI